VNLQLASINNPVKGIAVVAPPAGGRIRSQGNYCLPPAGVLHSQNKVIKCAAYGVAQARGWRYFININDMYNNDVGKGGAQGCEAYEVK
jgi:hypothetical protein